MFRMRGRPEAIIDGVVKGLGVLAEKRAAMEKKNAALPERKAKLTPKQQSAVKGGGGLT
jgi:hypothetical protein